MIEHGDIKVKEVKMTYSEWSDFFNKGNKDQKQKNNEKLTRVEIGVILLLIFMVFTNFYLLLKIDNNVKKVGQLSVLIAEQNNAIGELQAQLNNKWM